MQKGEFVYRYSKCSLLFDILANPLYDKRELKSEISDFSNQLLVILEDSRTLFKWQKVPWLIS